MQNFAEEVLAPINAIGDQQGATIDNGKVSMPLNLSTLIKDLPKLGGLQFRYHQKLVEEECQLHSPEELLKF